MTLEEVVRVDPFDGIAVHTPAGVYRCGALLLATGAHRVRPNIENLEALEGKGVSACAVCDGFFHRGKPVAVLGSGDFAASEAAELVPLAASVTILTNGQQPTADFGSLPVVTTPIARLTGDQLLQGAELEDGSFCAALGPLCGAGQGLGGRPGARGRHSDRPAGYFGRCPYADKHRRDFCGRRLRWRPFANLKGGRRGRRGWDGHDCPAAQRVGLTVDFWTGEPNRPVFL